MVGNPRCTNCGLYELNDGSEETLYTCECDTCDLEEILPREDHACSTGDCGHEKQTECDEKLAKDYRKHNPQERAT